MPVCLDDPLVYFFRWKRVVGGVDDRGDEGPLERMTVGFASFQVIPLMVESEMGVQENQEIAVGWSFAFACK